MTSRHLRPLGSTALTTVWSLMSTVGHPQWLQGLFRFSAVPPGPAARDLGRQQWWPGPVVCTQSAVGVSYRCLLSARGQQQTHTEW